MGGDEGTHFFSIPIETDAGNTTIHVNSVQKINYENLLDQPMSLDVDYTRKQLYIYNRNTASLEMLNFNPEAGYPNLTLTLLHSGLSRGQVKIAVDWNSKNLYWTDPTFRWLVIQSIQNSSNYKILVYDNLEQPTGIAVDPIHKYLFWSDVGSLPKIERSTLSGNSRKAILSQGIAYPIALDVDIASSMLYWVDSIRDTVERSKLDGTERAIIKRLSHTTFFDITVFTDVVFVTDFDPSLGGIVRLFNKNTGVDDKNVPLIRSTNSHIFCVAFYAPQPTITDHCSSNPCKSICVSESTGPTCLCQEGFVLSSDGRTCVESTGSLHRALVWATSDTICAADIRGIHDEGEYIQTNKTCFSNAGANINWLTVDSHDRTIIFADGNDIYAMTLDGVHTKQLVTSATENVTGPCDADNGDCEHICIPLGRNRICQCSYGYILESNKKTCSSEPLSDNVMYVSDWTHDKVYQVSLINNAVNALDSSTVDSPTGVLYNSITNRIYWGDSTSKYIQSAHVNGTGYSVLFDVGAYRAHPDRLALDYSTGNIYYTAVASSQLQTGFTGIGVVSPNGFHRKLILEGVHPRAIEIDPSKGYLFWTDFGTTPAVLKRAHTDGTNIVALYTSMVWPNGIAIDRSASVLYVTDGKKNIIYRCGYEANTCVQYFSDPGSQLMDIKLLGNYLYYTAWNKVYITRLHKTNSNDTAKFANNAELGRLDAISLYSSNFLPTNVQSQCSSNNKSCSTFCHPTPNSFTCGCPDGEQLLPDGKTCTSDITTTSSSTSTTTTTTSSTSFLTTTTATTKTTSSSFMPTSTTFSTTSPKIGDDKSNDGKASASQIMYIGAGAGGTVAIVIIVVVIVIVLIK
ncbi:low-density lipoprotein receptor-related protein 4-like [Dreissena polymorpha]|uniref:low-density lipoprotein receptor-related protein 4-like n=1 Tax=Dreissena polymorpha TaxID=45954 RepID=UPI002263D372|nr:low-density lipoprotein receptor-related protein 4-like [Dreissena polymorpha]